MAYIPIGVGGAKTTPSKYIPISGNFPRTITTEETTIKQPKSGLLDWLGISPDYLGESKQTATSFLKNPIGAIGEAVKAGVQSVKNTFTGIKEANELLLSGELQTPSQKIGGIASAVSKEMSAVFIPISAVFSVAEKLPGLREAASVINVPFAATGRLGAFAVDKFIDALPLNEEVKNDLKPGFEEVGSLAGQILLGAKILERITRGKEVSKKTTTQDAQEVKVVEPQAQKVLEDKVVEQKLAPIAQKGVKEAIPTEKGIPAQLEPLAQEARKIDYRFTKLEGMGYKNGGIIIGFENGEKMTTAKIDLVKDVLHIDDLGVLADVPEGKGYGTDLVNFIKQKAIEQKATKIVADNVLKDAEGFWARLGFKKAGKNWELTDLYNQAVKGGVPPTGNRVSGVAKSIEAKGIREGLIKEGEDLAKYRSSTFAEQRLLEEKYGTDYFKEVMRGKKQLPTEVKPGTAIDILEREALKTGDGKLMQEIASSQYLTPELSEAGSSLSLSRIRQDSVVNKIKDVNKELEKSAEKKMGGKAKDIVQKEIKDSVAEKVASAKKYSWDNFLKTIKDIEC